MVNYSYSKIETFNQCKLKYKLKYIDKIEIGEQTVEQFLGGLVHKTLEKLYYEIDSGKKVLLQDILGHFNGLWKENWNSDIRIVKENADAEDYLLLGNRFLTDYYNKYAPFNDTKTLAIETSHIIELVPGINYHIRIDRLTYDGNGVYSVRDYKTGSYLPTQDRLDNDKQLAMYSLWVKENFGDAQKVRLVWHYLAFNKELESNRTEEQLENLKKEVLVVIERIENEKEFTPTISKLCNWCEYQSMCPAWNKN
ncbi:MAG: PD-(D/E)XK nuclease family protein [Candidatus Woesearchaeota archaeon]|nr:MAG: PD-(D/E)XK nuclease family protein [Candidatus Woesearchaeota archaeon]